MTQHTPPKKAVITDWHKADIKAALEKAGWNLSSLSRHHGYSDRKQLSVVLGRCWPKGERLIADAIGVPPQTIWPSRYNPDGSCKGSGETRPETTNCNAGKPPSPSRKKREMQAAS